MESQNTVNFVYGENQIQQFILLKTQMENITHRKIVQKIKMKYLPRNIKFNFKNNTQFNNNKFEILGKYIRSQGFPLSFNKIQLDLSRNELSGSAFVNFFRNIRGQYNIRELDIDFSRNNLFMEKKFNEFKHLSFSNFQFLSKLTLKFNLLTGKWNKNSLTQLSQCIGQLQNLTHLHIELQIVSQRCYRGSPLKEGCEQILQNIGKLQNLKYIHISFSNNVCQAQLVNILYQIPNLEEVHIYCDDEIYPKVKQWNICKQISKHPNVKHVTISYLNSKYTINNKFISVSYY